MFQEQEPRALGFVLTKPIRAYRIHDDLFPEGFLLPPGSLGLPVPGDENGKDKMNTEV